MNYIATADTDVGIRKKTNQDSLLIKHGRCALGEVLLAVICDGMGGLEKGEVASATVVRAFAHWFDYQLPKELEHLDMSIIAANWSLMLKDLNQKIAEYGQARNISLGTTFTGVLFINQEYIVGHVGDSRLYYLGNDIHQITTDQTFVAREVQRGNLTLEQAMKDKRRNMLLQCVGASQKIEPEMLGGNVQKGTYILCSDGFRHEISAQEIYAGLRADRLRSKEEMHGSARQLINTVKARQERDNISVIVIKAS